MTITMYGADWCGDCRRAKAWFSQSGVPYRYVDLIETPDAIEIVLDRNNGKQSIPVIVFDDDSHLTEPSNDDLVAKLAELGESTARVVENVDDGRFEMWLAGELISFANYSTQEAGGESGTGGVIVVPHVETAPVHRGVGNAAKLMDGVLGLLRSTDRSIVPLCPFAADHIRNDERHHDLLAS